MKPCVLNVVCSTFGDYAQGTNVSSNLPLLIVEHMLSLVVACALPSTTLSSRTVHAGEFGAVIRGSYNGIPVAIKQVSLAGTVYASGRQPVDEFFRQVRLELSAMSATGTHPNIVQMFGNTGYFPQPGQGKDALQMEILLELVPNGTLWDNLHKKRMFQDWPEKMRVLYGIASGVKVPHPLLCANFHSYDIASRSVMLFCFPKSPKLCSTSTRRA